MSRPKTAASSPATGESFACDLRCALVGLEVENQGQNGSIGFEQQPVQRPGFEAIGSHDSAQNAKRSFDLASPGKDEPFLEQRPLSFHILASFGHQKNTQFG